MFLNLFSLNYDESLNRTKECASFLPEGIKFEKEIFASDSRLTASNTPAKTAFVSMIERTSCTSFFCMSVVLHRFKHIPVVKCLHTHTVLHTQFLRQRNLSFVSKIWRDFVWYQRSMQSMLRL